MLINDILDLSKIESGTVAVDVGEVRFADLAAYVERTFQHVAEATGLRFTRDYDVALPAALRTDAKRLQQVLKNLLSNAFKFAERGEVSIAARPVRVACCSAKFALILLDVNMPDMDGFETAALIRQRKSSEHTPIIFVTAHADEAYAARGYRLGAVDYIQAPVDAQILKTKVSVFLDLFRKTREAGKNAEALRRYAAQLRNLAAAAVAIHGASSLDDLLKVVADTATLTLGAQQVAIDVSAPALAHKPGGTARHAVLRRNGRSSIRWAARPCRARRRGPFA